MFSKTNRGSGPTSLSILAADCRLTGDISSDGEVHIDGRLEGDMVCKMLTVGETGVVTGKISADLVRILGSVNGQVKAQSVELGATARVVGRHHHASLKVDAGAYVQACSRACRPIRRFQARAWTRCRLLAAWPRSRGNAFRSTNEKRRLCDTGGVFYFSDGYTG